MFTDKFISLNTEYPMGKNQCEGIREPAINPLSGK